jgi:shikimate kinase
MAKAPKPQKSTSRTAKPARSVVLVGMMGAGKSTIGRRLAARLAIPFIDADAEIERAAGQTVREIFDTHGEDEFRRGEERVISRLLEGERKVIATGGGAFVNDRTRKRIKDKGVSIWLRAEIPVLLERVSRNNTRPLLKRGDPESVLRKLADERYRYYEQADIVVDSSTGPHRDVVDAIVKKLRDIELAPKGQGPSKEAAATR